MAYLTEKLTESVVRAMQYSSRPGENVLDLFGGSGSIFIADGEDGPKAYLMELDKLYRDLSVESWEKFAGRKAKRTQLRV